MKVGDCGASDQEVAILDPQNLPGGILGGRPAWTDHRLAGRKYIIVMSSIMVVIIPVLRVLFRTLLKGCDI